MKICDLVEGLLILATTEEDGIDSRSMCAEHDTIYAGSHLKRVTEEQRKRLIGMGWQFDFSVDRWTASV